MGLFLTGIGLVRAAGKNHLKDSASFAQPGLQTLAGEQLLTKEEEQQWQEGQVKYQGSIYQYNEEMLTFLIMGIDKNRDAEEVAEGTDGGQADALFLLALNPKDKSMKVIGINRNTITDVDIYDEKGEYVTTVRSQIAIQHGFGNGVEESCGYQKKAVENLFYQLPVHGYAAVNMSAISAINDAVGGVDVTVLEDMVRINEKFIKGSTIHLMGEDAFWYVKYRDTDVFGSADLRLERQKQYLDGLIRAAKQAVAENAAVVIELYQAIRSQMVTDITLDEAAYLAPLAAGYTFDGDSFYTLEGETVMGEQFEEFYYDEKALYEMILEIFYEKVR